MKVLLLSDGRPGHYHLAEGVVAAIKRKTEVELTRIEVSRHKFTPGRLLRTILNNNMANPVSILRLGYGISAKSLPKADLVVSAGGNTLYANIAAARILGASNIFCGSLRKVDPRHVSLVITSFERFAHKPNHLVSLKPNAMDPNELGRPAEIPTYGRQNPPKTAGLIIGGDSGLFTYCQQDWKALLAFVRKVTQEWGTRWIISTSPRTSNTVADAVTELADDQNIVQEFIDFRTAGPGTLKKVFASSDIALCTEDSSSMVSEAISARLPTIGVSPIDHSFEPREGEYRDYLQNKHWCRYLPIADLSVERLDGALGEIKPLKENHLETLADRLKERLPTLFDM